MDGYLGEVISEGTVDQGSLSFCSVIRKVVERFTPIKGNRKEKKLSIMVE